MTFACDLPLDLSLKGQYHRHHLNNRHHHHQIADHKQLQQINLDYSTHRKFNEALYEATNYDHCRRHFDHQLRIDPFEQLSSDHWNHRSCLDRSDDNPSPIDLHRSSSSSASTTSTSSSMNLQLNDKKRVNRPLTGKHVKHGTGASHQTIVTLRNVLRQRQHLAHGNQPTDEIY